MLKGNKHHANLIIGSPEETENFFLEVCEEEDFVTAGNPDFFPFKEEVFGIEEARKLSALASRKAVSGKKFFFISSSKITPEAQNALLKTFEDPYPDTRFFVSVFEESNILPTLRSRMMLIKAGGAISASEAKKFLGMSLKDRLAFAGKFAESGKSLPEFLGSLLSILKRGSKEMAEVHKLMLGAGNAPGAARLVLEHLALML